MHLIPYRIEFLKIKTKKKRGNNNNKQHEKLIYIYIYVIIFALLVFLNIDHHLKHFLSPIDEFFLSIQRLKIEKF